MLVRNSAEFWYNSRSSVGISLRAGSLTLPCLQQPPMDSEAYRLAWQCLQTRVKPGICSLPRFSCWLPSTIFLPCTLLGLKSSRLQRALKRLLKVGLAWSVKLLRVSLPSNLTIMCGMWRISNTQQTKGVEQKDPQKEEKYLRDLRLSYWEIWDWITRFSMPTLV